MATIKAIDAKSVHQIQSGQVIVDLCSVVKELVENSLDAGATSLEVRFKNNGLDAIEVQDNGSGIGSANYESIALKHYTSKLSSYDDLDHLQTFGFRGEALSSLCALSRFSLTTAQADQAPKGHRLEFERSGKLKSTSLVACQKGTTARVEDLFDNLPVRRKELTKSIKREYGKVLGLLHAYACICVNVKFTVKNAMPKNKSVTVFATQANATTRDNIANVYGAKTLTALMPLDLELEFQPTLPAKSRTARGRGQGQIQVKGHISRPIFGEGRQTPDRQMFFVNGRPCGLPQIAKAINEVYKAFNLAQSPFVFADLIMDTSAYDVNVSPDKRTILLHDAAVLIEELKTALNDLFERQDHAVPQSQLASKKLPAFQKLSFQSQVRESFEASRLTGETKTPNDDSNTSDEPDRAASLLREHFQNFTTPGEETAIHDDESRRPHRTQEKQSHTTTDQAKQERRAGFVDEYNSDSGEHHLHGDRAQEQDEEEEGTEEDNDGRSQDEILPPDTSDINRLPADRKLESAAKDSFAVSNATKSDSPDGKGVVTAAFERMRPRRIPAEVATVTIGDQTVTTILGSQSSRSPNAPLALGSRTWSPLPRAFTGTASGSRFSQTLRRFDAHDPDGLDEVPREKSGDSLSEPDASSGEEGDGSSSAPGSEDSLQAESDAECDDGDEDKQAGSDADYVDEDEEKQAEKARVAELIRVAEESSALPSKENIKRATKALSGFHVKDATTSLWATMDFSMSSVAREMKALTSSSSGGVPAAAPHVDDADSLDPSGPDVETRLSLTVSKRDFAQMAIVGQFNLGFILAVRPAAPPPPETDGSLHLRDELFIIDQHASDEKYNFERLQAETLVGSQRLVRPVTLDLTAVEEEIILDNMVALEKNGFLVDMDTSGERPVGERCRLVSLPLSKEVVFTTQDLEELIQLLAEGPGGSSGLAASIPRPSKVRKMFAMRACRSSIMIGKTLSTKQMAKVVSHMGTIDKPWNCPHGRPTMRHLCSLDGLQTWDEEDGERSLGAALRQYTAGGVD